MIACDTPGCKTPRVFFNKDFGHKVCLSCRMTYHSQLDFIKIPDAKLAKEAVETNSSWLQAMQSHSNTYNIEDLFKSFKGELSNFVQKNEDIRKRLKEAEDKDAIGEIDEIEKEAFELKKLIDSSEMMRNFTFHRFQINMDCATKGIITEEMNEDAQVKRLLTLAKGNMVQDFERRYEERFNKKSEDLQREYEEQYRTQIDECKNKIEQQDTIIENYKIEIDFLKEKTKEKDTQINKLEEEFKKKEVELEQIKTNESLCKGLFEFYKVKTGSVISDKYEDLSFSLSLNNDAHKQVLSVAKLFKLPPIRQLRFNYCEEPNSDLLEFLKFGSPDSVKHLAFGYFNYITEFKPIDYYLDGLEVASRGATEEVYMSYWTYSKESLQRLVKAGAGATRFIIWNCKMDLDSDLDFSGPDYKILYFGIPHCGNRVSEDWSGHPERLERIIKAFSKCGIKDSLQTFGVYQCGVSADKIKQMFNDNGMNEVSVIEEAKEYSNEIDSNC